MRTLSIESYREARNRPSATATESASALPTTSLPTQPSSPLPDSGSVPRVKASSIRCVSLDSEATVHVPGPLGDTVVAIRDGAVEVLSSPCPEKICIKTGKVSKPGQWIACLPNKVFVAVQGKRHEQPDAISQ